MHPLGQLSCEGISLKRNSHTFFFILLPLVTSLPNQALSKALFYFTTMKKEKKKKKKD
jgi:hypothetical protein